MNNRSNYRFLLNTDDDNLEVHDLDNENTNCQIDEIINSGNDEYLKNVDDKSELSDWLDDNPEYDGCAYCLPEFHKK